MIMTFDHNEEDAGGDFTLPASVDTSSVLFLGMLAGGGRPLRLDAAAVREIRADAAPLLVALLESTRAAGYPVGIAGASPALRRRWSGAPLAGFLDADCADELLFVCPDREAIGFHPSLR
jgi:hypothetical protein